MGQPNQSEAKRVLLGIPEVVEILRGIEQSDRKNAVARAKADPKKHRLTLEFDGNPTSYRYWEGEDGSHYCYSCWKNAAGSYLSWKETIHKDGSGERTEWQAHKTRKHAAHMAKFRAGVEGGE